MTTAQFHEWLQARKDAVKVRIDKIRFDELQKWGFREGSGNLAHDSGKFFSIEGIAVDTNRAHTKSWTQPIINQPEIGFLGIIVKEIDGILHFLMQAKIEPGNINFVQLSPTLQATKSNYSRVHEGNAPHYLEYFQAIKNGKHTVLLDQLQSEQGARFLRKRNRNIIIRVDEDVQALDDFCWLTLGQIQNLLQFDNLVNMDTRTVISGIGYGNYQAEVVDFFTILQTSEHKARTFESGMLLSAIENAYHLHHMEEIISWFTGLKSDYELSVESIGLKQLADWVITDHEIHHKDHKYFKVIAVRAEIENREVMAWTQPLVESVQEGIIAFIVKRINGVFHFLVQAKLEAGNLDLLELAPTVQCLTGNYRKGHNEYEPPFLEYVLKHQEDKEKVRVKSLQSEEGGRFFKEQNKNLIIEAGEEFPQDVPENYCWMTLNQLKTFIQYNNYLNIQARSLISTIKFC